MISERLPGMWSLPADSLGEGLGVDDDADEAGSRP